MKYLILSQLRFLWQHRLQTLLAIVGIALGVCVVIAVELTNKSANQSFINSFEQLNENVSHQITGPSIGIDSSLYKQLKLVVLPKFPNTKIAPIVEASGRIHFQKNLNDRSANKRHVSREKNVDETVRILGIDPISETTLQRFNLSLAEQNSSESSTPPDLTQLMLESNGAFISSQLAGNLNLTLKSKLTVDIDGNQNKLTIVGILPVLNGSLSNTIITDIDTAQNLSKTEGFTRIDLQIPSAFHEQFESTLNAFLNNGYYWQKKTSVVEQTLHLTRSFQLNLQALSLLSLLVGVFLVYNTMNNFVIQRVPLFQRLHAIGVLSQQIILILMIEVFIIATVATTLGIITGLKLSEFLVALSDQTINDLYYSTGNSTLHILWLPIVKGALLGIGASLLAVFLPARNIVHLNGTHSSTLTGLNIRAIALTALFLLVTGVIFSLWNSSGVLGGFFAVFVILLGLAVLTPLLIFILGNAIQSVYRKLSGTQNYLVNMSIGDSYRNLARTGVAAMALMVAVSSANGMGVMIGSFRLAVENWLNSRVSADIYVRSESSTQTAFIPEDLITRITENPGITSHTLITDFNVQVRKQSLPNKETLYLSADWTSGKFPTVARTGYSFIESKSLQAIEQAWTKFEQGQVFVSETFSNTHSVSIGDVIEVKTDVGLQSFTIAAIYYDYANQNGRILSNRNNLIKNWPDKGVESIGLYLSNKHHSIDVIAELQNISALNTLNHKITFLSGSDIIDIGLTVFDRTFIITHALKAFVLAVAMIAVFSSLTSLQLERTSELNTLRAIGFSRWQIFALAVIQTAFLGLIVGLIAIPAGELLAWLLIEIIHWRSFGWSMEFTPQWPVIIENTVLAIFAATVAALYPTWKTVKKIHSPTQYV